MFKNADWCETGKRISITSAVYKTHPLCCSGSYPMDVSPPDNSMLSSFSIQYLDSDFFNQINSSCQGHNNCSFVARSAVAGYINNPYCPRDPQKVNYVVIYFSCGEIFIANDLITLSMYIINNKLFIYLFYFKSSSTICIA